MLSQFNEFIRQNGLFKPSHKVLLALSGGVDSMVLFDLFYKGEVNFAVAHCNFNLRGQESDGDEGFVKKYVENTGVELFIERFETKEYARLNGISIEMAARDLRYEYFNKLCTAYNFDYIATAHHQDDLIETFFLNLVRKTGIRGLTGIKPKSGNLIRPLLFAGREMILKYTSKENIPFREDSSNVLVEYKRNYIRHKIIPEFIEVNPSFRKNILESIRNLKDVEDVYFSSINKSKYDVIESKGENSFIFIDKLLNKTFPRILLFEILNEFNFNPTVINEIFNSLSEESGKQFYSITHRVVKDREKLIITENKEKSEAVFYIDEGDMELFSPVNLDISWFDAKDFTIPRSPRIAYLDYKKLDFPLVIKNWQTGEYFKPLGMQGLKKISDFFIDEKLSIPEKENTWILYSANKVAWILGLRIDDRFKITSETKKIYRIEIH